MLLKRRLVWIVLLACVALACVVCIGGVVVRYRTGENDLSLTPLAIVPHVDAREFDADAALHSMSGEVYASQMAPVHSSMRLPVQSCI
jgi:hypothetical protein